VTVAIPPTDVVFAGLGSLGDVHPVLPVAKRLAERGHRCRIAVPPALALSLRGSGFDVRPVGPVFGSSGPRRRQSLIPDGHGAWESMLNTLAVASLAETVPHLQRLLEGAGLLVTTAWQLAGPIAAESLGVPWVTAHLFPSLIPSAHTPAPAGYPDWPTVVDRFATTFDAPVNDARRAAGLDARRDNVLRGNLSDRLTMVLGDEHMHHRAPDWPASVRLVGYPVWEDPRPIGLDDAAVAFLEAGAAPVLFYLGTAVAQTPDGFWDAAVEAARTCALRAILLTSMPVDTLADDDDHVLVRRYLPLHRVLPHVAALVHCATQGGMYGAIRYAVPSVVVPRLYDQPVNAARVEELGIGVAVPWEGLTGAVLGDALATVLGGGYRRRAAALRSSMARGQDPAGAAVDAIEAVLASDVGACA
jgi:rhamnosyltransferase subunit B